MRQPKDPIKDKLDKLAGKIADKALAENTTDEDRLEAFKLLTSYHVSTTKNKPKETEEPAKGDNFDDFQQSVKTSGRGPTRTGHA